MALVIQTPTHPAVSPNLPGVTAGDANSFRGKINTQLAGVEDKAQSIDAFLEQLQAALGNGALSGGVISAGSGFSVSITALKALVGTVVEFDATQTLGGLIANKTNNLYLRQDGTWSVISSDASPNYPTDISTHGVYFLWGTATTGGAAVTGVNNSRPTFASAIVGSLSTADSNFAGGYRQTVDGWFQDNVAASQAAVAMARSSAPTFGDKLIVPRAGSVTGVYVKSNAARTAGTLTVTVYKNGVAVALTAVLDGTNTTFKFTSSAKDSLTFAAGDELDLRVTTDAGWLPVTADIRAGLEIET